MPSPLGGRWNPMSDRKLLEVISDYLRTELFPDIDPPSQRVLLGLYRLVAQGAPVTIGNLATAFSMDSNAVRNILGSVEPSRLQYKAPAPPLLLVPVHHGPL